MAMAAKRVIRISAVGKREQPWVSKAFGVPMSQPEEIEDTTEDKEFVEFKARGNMAGLAKHLAKKLGGDPGFFNKCMAYEKLAGYDEDVRAAVCAQAHKRVTGIWPGAHGGADPNANEPAKKEYDFVYEPMDLKEVPTIVIDNIEDADWMHKLPGYAGEKAIHEELARQYLASSSLNVTKAPDTARFKSWTKKILAVRGEDYFLVQIGDDKAVVVNKETKKISEAMKPDAFIKFGYWEEVSSQDAEVLSLVKDM